VTEGFNLAGAAKTGVAEFYNTNQGWPTTNGSAGVSDLITSKYVQYVSVGSPNAGQILITYSSTIGLPAGQTVILSPTAIQGVSAGAVDWVCNDTATATLPIKYRPANCR
jgi:hypothetical protein